MRDVDVEVGVARHVDPAESGAAVARLVVTREHAKGDVALRAPASQLMLFLYGRAGTDGAEVFGDAGILDRWQELVRW